MSSPLRRRMPHQTSPSSVWGATMSAERRRRSPFGRANHTWCSAPLDLTSTKPSAVTDWTWSLKAIIGATVRKNSLPIGPLSIHASSKRWLPSGPAVHQRPLEVDLPCKTFVWLAPLWHILYSKGTATILQEKFGTRLWCSKQKLRKNKCSSHGMQLQKATGLFLCPLKRLRFGGTWRSKLKSNCPYVQMLHSITPT